MRRGIHFDISSQEADASAFVRLVSGLPADHRRMVKALLLRVADVEGESGEGAALTLIGQISDILTHSDTTH